MSRSATSPMRATATTRASSPQAIELIKAPSELGLSDAELAQLTLVYDKGNNSKTNQPLADELGVGVVGSLSPAQHPELLDVPASSSRRSRVPGTLAYRTTDGGLRPTAHDRDLPLRAVRRQAAALICPDARQGPPRARRTQGIVERGQHRMDERALEERIKGILKRRWLKDVITVEHDLAADAQLPHRPGRDRAVAQREWGKRIIFTDRQEWSDEQISPPTAPSPRARTRSARSKTSSSPATRQCSTGPTRSSACTPSTAPSR